MTLFPAVGFSGRITVFTLRMRAFTLNTIYRDGFIMCLPLFPSKGRAAVLADEGVIERLPQMLREVGGSSVKSNLAEAQTKSARHHSEGENLVREAWIFGVLDCEIA